MNNLGAPWKLLVKKEPRFDSRTGLALAGYLSATIENVDGDMIASLLTYDGAHVVRGPLMAAAPAMLAALKECESELRDLHFEHPVRAQIRAAITLASAIQ